jgi:hypothetical protein
MCAFAIACATLAIGAGTIPSRADESSGFRRNGQQLAPQPINPSCVRAASPRLSVEAGASQDDGAVCDRTWLVFIASGPSRQQLSLPDDKLETPGDFEADFLGHLNRIYGRTTPLPDGGLKGGVGFIVD